MVVIPAADWTIALAARFRQSSAFRLILCGARLLDVVPSRDRLEQEEPNADPHYESAGAPHHESGRDRPLRTTLGAEAERSADTGARAGPGPDRGTHRR